MFYLELFSLKKIESYTAPIIIYLSLVQIREVKKRLTNYTSINKKRNYKLKTIRGIWSWQKVLI